MGKRHAICGDTAARLRLGVRAGVRRQEGQAMVETAMSLLVVTTVAFGLFEFCMLAYTYAVLNDAAREGVRYAIVHGTDSGSCSGPGCGGDPTGNNVVAVVNSYAALSLHDTSQMTVTVTYGDSSGPVPMSLVTVNVNYAYVPYFSTLGLSPTVALTSQGRIVY